jgi:hypothetical protein
LTNVLAPALCIKYPFTLSSGSVSITRVGNILTLSNPIFLSPAHSPALIYFGWEIGWWITCNYPTVLKEKTETERVQPALSVG